MYSENSDSKIRNTVSSFSTFYHDIFTGQPKLRRKRERWEQKQQKLKEDEERSAKLLAEASKLPQERKTSIDLDESLVKPMKFTQLRAALVLKFFVRHFIKMTRKAHEFKAYA